MTLIELKRIIDFELENDQLNASKNVVIKLKQISCGPATDCIGIRNVGFGIDWDSHHFIISPTKELTTTENKSKGEE